jgi:hypothetical protein
MFSGRAGNQAIGMNLKATRKSQILYVVNTVAGGQVLYRERDITPRRPSRWERLKRLAGGAQAAGA